MGATDTEITTLKLTIDGYEILIQRQNSALAAKDALIAAQAALIRTLEARLPILPQSEERAPDHERY